MKFKNISEPDKEFTIEQVISKSLKFIKEDSEHEYRIIVGSDSLHRTKKTCFATAIIIHRIGKCAKLFYTRTFIENYPRNIVTRIMKEVSDSVEVISKLQDSDLVFNIDDDNWAVHIDCGAKGESQKVIHEALSYVKAMGFHGEIKPDACVGSHVADKFTGHT